jgi:hypothetical protein
MNKDIKVIDIKKAGIVYLVIYSGKLIGSNSSLSGAIDHVYSQFDPINTKLNIDIRE